MLEDVIARKPAGLTKQSILARAETWIAALGGLSLLATMLKEPE
jgi:hypothetical protein